MAQFCREGHSARLATLTESRSLVTGQFGVQFITNLIYWSWPDFSCRCLASPPPHTHTHTHTLKPPPPPPPPALWQRECRLMHCTPTCSTRTGAEQIVQYRMTANTTSTSQLTVTFTSTSAERGRGHRARWGVGWGSQSPMGGGGHRAH